MKLYSEADVRELLVFGSIAGLPARDYKEAGEFIAAAEELIASRGPKRLCGDAIVHRLLQDLHDDEGEIEAQLRRDLAAASEGGGC